MNLSQLRKQLGRTLRVRPLPRRKGPDESLSNHGTILSGSRRSSITLSDCVSLTRLLTTSSSSNLTLTMFGIIAALIFLSLGAS
jgi:hypothetical protein